jgi:hypothetical protein
MYISIVTIVICYLISSKRLLVRCGTSCTTWDVRQAPGRPGRPGTMYYPSGKTKKTMENHHFFMGKPTINGHFHGKITIFQ